MRLSLQLESTFLGIKIFDEGTYIKAMPLTICVIRVMNFFRAKDPFLVHRYHDKDCEPLKTAEDQYNACKKTEASHRMPISFLNQTVLEFLATKRI